MNTNVLGMLGRSNAPRLGLLVTVASVVSWSTPICSAQGIQPPTIRVETREVIIPVHVIEQRKDPKGLLIGPGGEEQHVYLLRSEEVTGLSAKAFHIFEDGVEEKIQHFSLEGFNMWLAQDNIGQHEEYSCTPKGIWTGSDEPRIPVDDSQVPHTYLLTYIPPPSSTGSCHQVEIKVDHKRAKVYAPEQYCNTRDPLSDPLNGIALGNHLQEFADSGRTGTLPLGVQSSSSADSNGTYRINLTAEIPASLLDRRWEATYMLTSIAVLGLVYDKNHALAYRFSDVACSPSDFTEYNGPIPPKDAPVATLISVFRKDWEDWTIPSSYRTQFNLEPGDYRLELVLTDGKKFGRATVTLNLEGFAKEHMAISGIALCKRYRPASNEPRSPSQAPQYVPLVFNGTEFIPTGDTRFRKGEHFSAFFEIYGAQIENPARRMNLQVRVVDSAGEVKLDSGLQALTLSTPAKNSSAPVVREVSTDALSLGSYRLEVQVSDVDGRKTAWSSAAFTVE